MEFFLKNIHLNGVHRCNKISWVFENMKEALFIFKIHKLSIYRNNHELYSTIFAKGEWEGWKSGRTKLGNFGRFGMHKKNLEVRFKFQIKLMDVLNINTFDTQIAFTLGKWLGSILLYMNYRVW